MATTSGRQILAEAIAAGEILSVVYHGGSQPGTVRQLAPIRLGDEHIRARDIPTGHVKTFLISKIELVSEDGRNRVHYAVPEQEPECKYETLPDALASKCVELEALGWHINLKESAVSLHSQFKNGKIKKSADAGIFFRPENPSRNWYVFGPGLAAGRSYAGIGKAVAQFLEQARRHAPLHITTLTDAA